jgi:hypothetical protein
MKAEVTITDHDRSSGEKKPEGVQSFRYNGQANSLWNEQSVLSGLRKGRRTVRCLNPKYAWKAEGGDANAPLLVKSVIDPVSVTKDPPDARSSTVLDPFIRCAVEVPVYMNFIPVPDLVAGPTFRVTGASTASAGGEELELIVFESGDTFKKFQFPKGQMLLDPKRGWAVRRLACLCVVAEPAAKVAPSFRITINNEYSGDLNGFPVPRSSTTEIWGPGSNDPLKNIDVNRTPPREQVFAGVTREYKNFGPGDVEPAACMMSTFDLPEPSGARRSRGWVVWLLGSLAGVVLLFVVRWARRGAGEGAK